MIKEYAVQCYERPKYRQPLERIRGFVAFGKFDFPAPVIMTTLEDARHRCEILEHIYPMLDFRPVYFGKL